MPNIFISYRRKDLQNGVEQLVAKLRSHFGDDLIHLDRDSFAGGTEWSSQNRAHVAQANVILCVIGPAWVEESSIGKLSKEEDYLQEELNLARSLGKSIIPVFVGQEEAKAIAAIPPKFKWLCNFHMLDGRMVAPSEARSLVGAIENIIGTSYRGSAKGSVAELSLWVRAIRTLLESLIHPTSVAASALMPTHRALDLAWRQYVVSGMTYLLVLYNISDTFTTSDVANTALVQISLTLCILAVLSVMALVFRSQLPMLSRFNFSLQAVSSINLLNAIGLIFAFLLIPMEDLIRLGRSFDFQDLVFKFATILQEIGERDPARALGIVVAEFGYGLLSIWLGWGFIRGAAIALRWHWRQIAATIGAAILIAWIPFYSYSVFFNPPSNSKPFTYRSSANVRTVNGEVRDPVIFLASGTISIILENNTVVVQIDELSVDNTTDNEVGAKIYCQLMIRSQTNQEFDWEMPIPTSERQALPTIAANTRSTFNNITIVIPLPPEYLPDRTALRMWVDSGGKIISLNDGGQGVLSWYRLEERN